MNAVIPSPPVDVTTALEFLDRSTTEAVAVGEVTLRIFSGHPDAGFGRQDFCDAVVSGGEAVSAIEQDCIRFLRTCDRRDEPGMMSGIPIGSFRTSILQKGVS